MQVLRSSRHVISIGGYLFSLVAEDWDSVPTAERAVACARAKTRKFALEHMSFDHPLWYICYVLEGVFSAFADEIVTRLKLDPARPFGRSLILEPMEG